MKKGVRVVAKGVKRSEPDLRKLARALIQLVMTEQANEQDQNENGEVSS